MSKYHRLKCKANKAFFKPATGIVFEGYLKIVSPIKMIVDTGFVRNEETLQPEMYLNKYGGCSDEA